MVIYDDQDYISTKTLIEAVCNDLDFQIKKLDYLGDRKNQINKISEAFLSKRISSVRDFLKNKTSILEKILNNEPTKFLNFFTNVKSDKENPLKFSNNANNANNNSNNCNTSEIINSNNNSNTIAAAKGFSRKGKNNLNTKEITDFYTSDITKERETFKSINHNMMKFVNNKRTLILIIDSFANLEESRSYINSITSKINETKTPIVVLTGILFLFNFIKFFHNFFIKFFYIIFL